MAFPNRGIIQLNALMRFPQYSKAGDAPWNLYS